MQTNKRKIAADDFFKGMYETALAADEIITAVSFPVPKKAAYVKFPNPASRFALVGVFVAQTGSGVRVAVTGAGACASSARSRSRMRWEELHRRCRQERARSTRRASTATCTARAEYRAHLIAVLASRAVAAAG